MMPRIRHAWSTSSLNFDPDFVIMTKAQHSKKKKWRTIRGLTGRSDGWVKETGKTKDQCKKVCQKSTTCLAFSYRSKDLLCLLSTEGIEYSVKWNHYEKSGQKRKKVRFTRQGGPTMPKKKKKVQTLAAKKTEKTAEEVKSLIHLERDKLKLAKERIEKAEKKKAKAEKSVQDEKEKSEKRVKIAKQKDTAELKKKEEQFSKNEAKKNATEDRDDEVAVCFCRAQAKSGPHRKQSQSPKRAHTEECG